MYQIFMNLLSFCLKNLKKLFLRHFYKTMVFKSFDSEFKLFACMKQILEFCLYQLKYKLVISIVKLFQHYPTQTIFKLLLYKVLKLDLNHHYFLKIQLSKLIAKSIYFYQHFLSINPYISKVPYDFQQIRFLKVHINKFFFTKKFILFNMLSLRQLYRMYL